MRRIAALIGLLALALGARAQDSPLDHVRQAFAEAIYRHSAPDINFAPPQPLLRAVVVLRMRLRQDGRWDPEVVRDNDEQPEMTRKALESVRTLVERVDVPGPLREELKVNGFLEAWLFQNDGHFALRTLALPQRGQ